MILKTGVGLAGGLMHTRRGAQAEFPRPGAGDQ
jgi:hypothetical protein